MPDPLREPESVPATGGAPVDEVAAVREELAELTAEIEGLRRALQTRPLIDLAKGMLMQRYACGDAAAFGLLRRFSQENNVKIRDLAAGVVARVEGDVPGQVDDAAAALATRLFEPAPDAEPENVTRPVR